MNCQICAATPRMREEYRLSRDELSLPFRNAEKPTSLHRFGVEAEKFGWHRDSNSPLKYAGDNGVEGLLTRIVTKGYSEEREYEGGPVIALSHERSAITLEPGAQLELSGTPHANLHAVDAEMREHYALLADVSEPLGIVFCSVGFHPIAEREALPWVPKQRYKIMREYLPTLGNGALDMMQRTATIQVNFDYENEADAMRKLRLMLKLSPIVHAMTANAPLYEGRLIDTNSVRGDVWTRMDPARTGLIERLWSERELCYEDYIEWALDAGMFLIKRKGNIIANTGQTFRDFLRRGYQGYRATESDWLLHLATLFPEVRLKNTLEVRGCDAQSRDLSMAVPALWVGLVHDEVALRKAETVAAQFCLNDVERARPQLIREGYGTKVGSSNLESLAEALIDIARDSLLRRGELNAQGLTENVYLAPLGKLVEQRRTPSDSLRERIAQLGGPTPENIVEATRIC